MLGLHMMPKNGATESSLGDNGASYQSDSSVVERSLATLDRSDSARNQRRRLFGFVKVKDPERFLSRAWRLGLHILCLSWLSFCGETDPGTVLGVW